MKKLLLPPLPLYLLPHFLQIATLLSAPIYYTPVEDITINCGYSGTLLNMDDNRNWTGDINSKFSPSELNQANTDLSSQVRKAPPSSSVSQVPYTTARLSLAQFTYKVSLSTGQKFIRFYFHPVSYGPGFDRSKALFSVQADFFTLLHDFNASVTADAFAAETLRREFCLNIDEGQNLTITFTPNREIPDAYAFINGIEIVSMPTNLYYTASESHGVDYVGNEVNYRIENITAMEMMYRINIGGSALSFGQDTGMYRNWDSSVEEQKYLDDLSSRWTVLPQNVSIQLNFAKIPEYSAPQLVYQTGRSMGNNHTRNKSYKLTWEFPVDPEFLYLLRLHFCEFEPEIMKKGDRSFLIHVDNQLAEPEADIIVWSGGNGSPIYKDYVVFMPRISDQKKVKLFLALQPDPSDWMTKYNDVLLNGLELFKLSDTTGYLAGPNPDPPPYTPAELTPSSSVKHNTKSNRILAIAAGVASGLLVLSVLFGFLIFRRRLKAKSFVSIHGPTKSTESRGSSLPPYLCRYFPLAEIKAATQNFNDSFIIGVGGFGNVYKGNIDDGGATLVAIKRLKPESSQGANEFKTEIELLSQLRHRHLVSLIGYCTDDNEMILVYDYMARGTLADHLYHNDNPPLSWEQRLQICIGAARGLSYLHTGAKGTIIHRDVKSTNILLDEKWVAKVSDFGLSKMGTTNTSKTHISTMVKGSFGYLDPEYYRRQRLTEKSDVYSFGVVLCEVLCARPAVMHTVELKQMNLAEWVRSCHLDGELDQIIDPSIRGKIEIQCLNQFVEIAMSCMNDSGIERPSMNDVVRVLELALHLHRNCIERNNEVAFVNDSAAAEIRSAKPGCATNESIQCISETIFSEINDPNGR
ncbi:receptor-like protein kinase FERONIA [Prunus avium]|uniref:Receptor-like protein kinase FERONIA n=1 Tax=Prunus avium TaxID=42229 RepID=A0A6P5SR98_PRUAV|nr:receptor-like protein kinase FERONIA [Prunus avium]